ncbi:MAG TPA: hypothetical protein VMV82_07520 [Candidatus Dormibacteraeota bacterium]|nr:hypothetical protein [Candidatus Dormibacteraeota bacterium]
MALLGVVAGASPSGAAVPASDVWSKLAIAAREHRNAVYNVVMDNEAAAALDTAALALTTAAACKDAYLAPGIRVFVSDLSFLGLRRPDAGFGQNCRFLDRRSKGEPTVKAIGTFNDAWLYVGPVAPTSPAPFYGYGPRYSVPTMRLSALTMIENVAGIMVIELHCRDARYGFLLFPGTPSLGSVRNVVEQLVAIPGAGDMYRLRNLREVRLQLPVFALTTTIGTSVIRATRRVPLEQTSVIRVNEHGVGRAWDWPPLTNAAFSPTNCPRREAMEGNCPPVTASFNHPFYFAIVYWSAHALLFVGYVAHPTLNAE